MKILKGVHIWLKYLAIYKDFLKKCTVYRCEISTHDIDANKMFIIIKKIIHLKPISMRNFQSQKKKKKGCTPK
jgi:hypothetical protein